ncbi:hypothetical protein I8G32_04411 [Rhodopseudomonas palustris]|nr:hypothetical protein B1S06_14210 [Rhodopseudomonas palustris]QQM05840.1 hypothetical protein I8G32_04411 [Rhodopseudomonas palustris]
MWVDLFIKFSEYSVHFDQCFLQNGKVTAAKRASENYDLLVRIAFMLSLCFRIHLVHAGMTQFGEFLSPVVDIGTMCDSISKQIKRSQSFPGWILLHS